MMERCPHCKEEFDPGEEITEGGIRDGTTHVTWCPSCDKEIEVQVSIDISYQVTCCEGQHDLEVYDTFWHKCTRCDFLDLIDKENLGPILKAEQLKTELLISKRASQ